MRHDHSHHAHHHHRHSHGSRNFSFAFAIGITFNTVFVAVEALYGYFAHSLALMADAGHNLSDVGGLALAWGAFWLAKRKPSRRYTYGLRSSSILAALLNALILLATITGIIWEAVGRLRAPEEVASATIVTVAGIGILINAATALLFASGRKGDLNIRGAYLHMAADALVSAGVVVAGILIAYTHWNWLDPAVSLAISAVILFGTWGLLRDSFNLAVAAVPSGIDSEEVSKSLRELPGVTSVHDLHIWAMSTTETALTAHLVIPGGHPGDEFLHRVSHELEHAFGIHHVTLQIELGNSATCHLEPDHVV
jgi:cobalt-zinc-cadmium efflux system protein